MRPERRVKLKKERDSLLLQSDHASIAAIDARLQDRGEYSGAQLWAANPAAYREIARLHAEGLGIRCIARIVGVHPLTVCAVREREGWTAEQDKLALLKDLKRAAKMSVERVIEIIGDQTQIQALTVATGIIIDKIQLMIGEATSRVEHVELDREELMKIIDGAVEVKKIPEKPDQD